MTGKLEEHSRNDSTEENESGSESSGSENGSSMTSSGESSRSSSDDGSDINNSEAGESANDNEKKPKAGKLYKTELKVDDIRGKREVTLVFSAEQAVNKPEEMDEKLIPDYFNDKYAEESDSLRVLDDFFFCDEKGNPISLEIMEKKAEERPRILGFGTIIEPLPPQEMPCSILFQPMTTAGQNMKNRRRRSRGVGFGRSRKRVKKVPPKNNVQSIEANSEEPKTQEQASVPQTDGLVDEKQNIFQPSKMEGLHDIQYRMFESKPSIYSYPKFNSSSKSIWQLDGLSPREEFMRDQSSSSVDSDSSMGDSSSESDGSTQSAKNSVSDSDGSSDDSDSSEDDSDTGKSNDKKIVLNVGFLMQKAQNGEKPNAPKKSNSKAKSSAAKPKSKTPLSRAKPSPSKVAKGAAKPKVKPKSVTKEPQKSKKPIESAEKKPNSDKSDTEEITFTEEEWELLECGFKYPTTSRRQRIFLPDVKDWCLDYSPGNPTLWIITDHAWYKIAGPIGGVLPHKDYRETFKSSRMLFEACYRVAFVLKEWLPYNRKLSYRQSLQEIVAQSNTGRYPLTSKFLIQNCEFITSQIADLDKSDPTRLSSMFFKQLKRLHQNHTARVERMKREKALKAERQKQREEAILERRRKKEMELEQKREEREALRALKEAERLELMKYPMEDLELLAENGGEDNVPKRPEPTSSLSVSPDVLGDIIMIWQLLVSFSARIGIETVCLEALMTALQYTEGMSVYLSQLFTSLLLVILQGKSYDDQIDFMVSTKKNQSTTYECVYGMDKISYIEILDHLTWQDILRQVISKDVGIDSSIGAIEPLIGCERVLKTLLMENTAAPFNHPVDPEALGLEDYFEIVKEPMDLGTIKENLKNGIYETHDTKKESNDDTSNSCNGDVSMTDIDEDKKVDDQTKGHQLFATHVRLVWDNATLYNGEESNIGKAALALSDTFEQEYRSFVLDKISANEKRIVGYKEFIKNPAFLHKFEESNEFKWEDVTNALYSCEFEKLPLRFKVACLSWLLSEYMKLDSIRDTVETKLQEFMSKAKSRRAEEKRDEIERKEAEKLRRDTENSYIKECESQDISYDEATAEEHPEVVAFRENIQQQRERAEKEYLEKKNQREQQQQQELNKLCLRVEMLGKDRYHNRYWTFDADPQGRIFVEDGLTGHTMVYTQENELEKLINWLNPKGKREIGLRNALMANKNELLKKINSKVSWSAKDLLKSRCGINVKNTLDLAPFLLDVPAYEETNIELNILPVIKKPFLILYKKLTNLENLNEFWINHEEWFKKMNSAMDVFLLRDLILKFESIIITINKHVIWSSWTRKRSEWRLSMAGSETMSQIAILSRHLGSGCVNTEALDNFVNPLDRNKWMELRSKQSSTFIPEINSMVIYFGKGHKAAIIEDTSTKLLWSGNDPITGIFQCQVKEITYHRGSGDPYARITLNPIDIDSKIMRSPKTYLCRPPSGKEQLSQLLSTIVNKMRNFRDSGPFLEPVSSYEFPTYYQLIKFPMDISTLSKNVQNLTYNSLDEFMNDVNLISSNCHEFCKNRFPSLPPIADKLVQIGQQQAKNMRKKIEVCEGEILEDSLHEASTKSFQSDGSKRINTIDPFIVIIRLENRLPEFVVDIERYEEAITKQWDIGDRFQMQFRESSGHPGVYYTGRIVDCESYSRNGLLPWECLHVTWEEDDGSEDSRVNPWEIETVDNMNDRKRKRRYS